ncbi:alpha,alpha-phosphotrehalase [Listeria cossartiae subsp. cayugensis]|uniref:Alpha,alpha-phosphotrehalase n=1 Tax=Listeria cossartiae subsp. cayugensis TaxID=2713505 RepID=A0ABU2IK24_9LIST|nr:alpha,alpha-phosphotrehalase [Listeria cossartiae]MDT0013320.1 alpha,alpha-phosphotrehalase [Listeria cossartiae subsp. cayugensis]MDT0048534.1 alpha,alpha-phosphotrehalase [Listeria cossartiae subsp. cayugensis]MDT0065037.1 alpha,alpha-phosphotrehalase [Listeria cossartiae subsp. cayugensis]MDT0079359.1 alpha,alpha-phosphotrehalase [Listeria cossartiae subsp. cayugensis]MDT0082195.1 alpha,alpha-phosphotrehalase [Listeria cossartiae subsp. cayugensis]
MKKFAQKTIYQVYPRSFYDTTGDGTGDIPGITAKLDYLQELGIEMIWLNPFYPSPQNDNGYDISDYTAVDPLFGTMDDVTTLINEAKKRDIGIMIDLVLNHTSTEHPWFKKALAGDPFYRDFYYFRQAKADGSPPTNWESKFGGSAWEKLPDSSEYYMHLYDITQADLDWANPHVREALFDVVNFWIDKGVEGFRLDVLNVIAKPKFLEDDFEGDGRRFYTDGPGIHTYLKELHERTFGDKPIITVGEMSSTDIDNCIRYSKPDEKELSMVFHFHHLKVDYPNGEKWRLDDVNFANLKAIFHTWQVAMSEENGWDALFWNNHDQPRALGRFATDQPEHYYHSATLLGATIHFMRGTPFVYMGEEIGMMNPKFETIDDYVDVETLNHFDILQKNGLSEQEVMEIIKERSRDNSRTPMQWDNSENAGFTTGTPWIKVADNANKINVQTALSDKTSIFYFYQKLIALRKEHPVIQTGDYTPFLTEEDAIIAYKRSNETSSLLAIHHFGATPKKIQLPTEFLNASVLLSNYERQAISSEIELAPYETLTLIQ